MLTGAAELTEGDIVLDDGRVVHVVFEASQFGSPPGQDLFPAA